MMHKDQCKRAVASIKPHPLDRAIYAISNTRVGEISINEFDNALEQKVMIKQLLLTQINHWVNYGTKWQREVSKLFSIGLETAMHTLQATTKLA